MNWDSLSFSIFLAAIGAPLSTINPQSVAANGLVTAPRLIGERAYGRKKALQDGQLAEQLLYGGAHDGLQRAPAGKDRQRRKRLAERLVDVRVGPVSGHGRRGDALQGQPDGSDQPRGEAVEREDHGVAAARAGEAAALDVLPGGADRDVVHHAAVAEADEVVAREQAVEKLL